MKKLIGRRGVLDSYGISGKAKESRPMESEHTVVEINLTLLLYEKLVIN